MEENRGPQPIPPEPELPIAFEATLTEADFSEVWSQIPQFRRRQARWLLLLMCAGLACLAALAARSSGMGELPWVFVVVPGLLALVAVSYLWWSPRAWARQSVKATGDGPIGFSFDDAGLSVESSVSSYQLGWTALRHWIESDDALLVYTRQGALVVMPKRAFGGQLDLLRVLLLHRLQVRPQTKLGVQLVSRPAWHWLVLSIAFMVIWHWLSK